MNPEICIIAAIGEGNNVIGKDGGKNGFPWPKIPADLKHFRKITTPHPVIMGRKTWDSLDEYQPLPDRSNLVITRQTDFVVPDGARVCRSVDQALATALRLDNERIFIMGGGEIYRQTIDLAVRLYLTLIEGQFEGDTYFPDYSMFDKVVSEQAGQSGDLKYKFLELEKAQPPRRRRSGVL